MSNKPQLPDRLVVMGRIVAPFGIKGWVKIQTYTATPRNLTGYPTWSLGRDGQWQERAVEDSKPQGQMVVAKFAGMEDRDAAAALKGFEVAVPRDALPAPEPGEYYWSDLLGLRVENMQGQQFGTVDRMMETGANDVLVVVGERERLIPFIADAVKSVDLATGVMVVDWDPDY